MDADPMFNLRLRIPPQRSAAISKLNSVIEGPSILMLMRLSRVVVFNRFHNSVLIRFMVENARSHSAVLTGIRAAILHSFDRLGNSIMSDWSVQSL